MSVRQPGGPPVAVIDGEADLRPALNGVGIDLGRPAIVLCGGAARLDEQADRDLAPLVRDGLLKPAAELGAVIIDGGTDAGVMAIAGRARRELGWRPELVGVAPRGRVAAPAGSGTTPLEQNHSLVLLAPGTEWGEETQWLLDVARLVGDGLPVVAVLINGGPVALSEAIECAARGWPVVAVAGTGRSADLLAGYAAGSAAALDVSREGIHVVQAADGPARLAATLRGLIRPMADDSHADETSAATPDLAVAAGPIPARPGSADYPALYVAASAAAKRGQRMHRRLSLADIGFTTLGLAIILTASWLQPLIGLPSDVLNGATIVISALSFLVALIIKFIARASGYDADWYSGRALAETAKSLSWRYMMRTQPYTAGPADRRFTVDLAQLLRSSPGFRQATDQLPAHPQQISPLMRSVRGLSVATRRAYYVEQRLAEQADWYRQRSVSSNRAGARWFWLSVLFQIAAAGLAIAVLGGWGDALLRLIALLGSIALAIVAWSQLNRYDELARSYGVAFQELSLIMAVAGEDGGAAGLEDLVRDGEQAIGREHQLWLAKRTGGAERPSEVDDGGVDDPGDGGGAGDGA